ncbi:MAG: carboxypeptidase-like regulatory domain-containing protein [Flavobacterium sp.]|uniref:carboxypeptidase-like regulatory domain-containing protein n=1 Tax=Flavobacterium sp. TaxID=239 RepID=UPI002633FA87|nr:carboxypeptidase-like regulatory domain-containing protein [Flavobacterium sp.]MDD5150489.1 carboxypeptidase-like regulatory domain-containing protein [Flavobacterium sp.]
MKNLVLCLGLALSFIASSCSLDNWSSKDEPQINSSWILKNTSGGIAGINDNFNNGDVIWDFNRSNQTLTVTKKVNTTGSGIPAGTYSYTLKQEGKTSLIEIKQVDVVYTTLTYEFLNENGVVFKDEALADGFQYTFVKNCGETIFCTLEAVAGINVYVKLGNSNSTTTDGVTIVAKSGNYTETLMPFPNNTNPSFAGAYEKAATYIITVSKAGYKTYTSGQITVTSDCCHVIPQTINIVLQPN